MLVRPRTVAIVDDDPTVLKGLERLLLAYGFQPESFESAEAFLNSAMVAEADCLVLDIHLGGMSGIELRKRLTASGSALPVIFMSAFEDEATRKEASDAGCVAFLGKPFLASLLMDALDRAVDYRRPRI